MLLFLRSTPCLLRPQAFFLPRSFGGTGGAVDGVMVRWDKALSAAWATLFCIYLHNLGAKLSISGEYSSAEVFAQHRIGNKLRTETNLAIVQQQTIPLIAVGAQLTDELFCLSELGISHARQRLSHCQTPAYSGCFRRCPPAPLRHHRFCRFSRNTVPSASCARFSEVSLQSPLSAPPSWR